MRKKNLLLVGILLILAMLFAACGKEEDIPNQESEKQEEVADEPVEEPSEEPSLELENAVPEEEEVIVEEEPQIEEPQVDWSKATSVWTTEELNLRVEPNADCDIITVFAMGTELKKASEENGWAYIQCGEYEG